MPMFPLPLRCERSHGQGGDGADSLTVGVPPKPLSLRLQVGQIHGGGRIPHTLPEFT